ncbi:MAG: glycosyltransferase [Pyrinomonadaceae bacterium]|nr:glycosyltransferase [Pyrinomonadaceae bacterium]
MHAPAAIFTYKRPEHTRATIEALARNTLAAQTDVYIFSDGPKSKMDLPAVEAVRLIARTTVGFASVKIIERERNMGLANSIITGVTEILNAHDNIIVLEDDLVSAPYFLSYMNAALENYREDPHVFSVTGHTFPAEFMPVSNRYPYDTYVGYRCSSWSWGTWPDRWRRIDWDMKYFASFSKDLAAQKRFNRGGQDMTTLLRMQHEHQIGSWAIRFCFAHHTNDMYCIYPIKSLIKNIGLDYSGTHSVPNPKYFHSSLDESWLPQKFCPADTPDPNFTANFRAVFDPSRLSIPNRIARWIRNHVLVPLEEGKRLVKKNKNRLIPPVKDVDVLVVNTYQKNGGAARAAYRTFCGIRNRYAAAHYLTLTKEDLDPNISGRSRASDMGMLVQGLARLDRIPLLLYPRRQHVPFSPAFWPNPLRISLARFRSKLVHLHWVGAGLLRVEELARLSCPIVWTLHDAWAFTGGCHYTRDCEGFKKLCGRCPQLGSQREDDYSRSLMRRKTKAFEKLALTVVTPSRWQAEMAKQSSLFAGRRIEVIPNGLDTEVFKPMDYKAAREYLNLRPDIPVLLFGAQSVTDPRKGWDLLCDAMQRLERPYTLLVFGDGKLCLENAPHITVRHLGSLTDDVSLALMYSAADVFMCPSREDNLPNTVAEALACGTPCVAFDINGLPEMIEHQKNGWLARPFDSADLAEGILWVTRHSQQDKLRKAAREKAISEYSMAVMGDRYIALYSDLLKSATNQT